MGKWFISTVTLLFVVVLMATYVLAFQQNDNNIGTEKCSDFTDDVPKTGCACTAGDSWCEDRTRGGYERSCNCNSNGVCTWGPLVKCADGLVYCSSTGWGGRC